MKNILATIGFIFLTIGVLESQNNYLKFTNDTLISGKKIFKGEIFLISKEIQDSKTYTFNIGSESFTVIRNVEKMNQEPTDWDSIKDNLIKSKGNDSVYFNIKIISPRNWPIWLISERNEKILLTKPLITLNLNRTGKSFHLIISNSPTIYYTFDNLTKLPEQGWPKDSDLDGIQDDKDKCPVIFGYSENNGCPEVTKSSLIEKLTWWQILLFSSLFIFIIYFLIRYFMPRKLKSNEVIFRGSSLSEFADKYGGLDKLNSLNLDIIPTKSEWSKIKNDERERKKQIKKLKGKIVIVKALEDSYPESTSSLIQESNFQTTDQSKLSDSPNLANINLINIENLSLQMKQIERNILDAIKVSSSKGNDNLNELTKLNRQISDLKNEKDKVESERINFEATIKQLNKKADDLNINIKEINDKKNQLVSDLNNLQEKIIAVDFLSGYCDAVLSYLVFCENLVADAFSFLNRIDIKDLQQNISASLLINKFQTTINKIPIGNWMQILEDIKETGVTNSKQIKSCFKQIDNIEDKKKQFQRLLFSEVLITYSSSILILAEEFRNLEHFHVPVEIANEARSAFSKHVTNIISKVKPTGLENKYVPLFSNFEEYLGIVMSIDSERSNAYKVVKGLEKGAIAEIVSYGVKTIFEETKTLIILV